MKYLTKENILLALVSLLVLAMANDMRQGCKGSGSRCEAVQQRGRVLERGDWAPRMDAMKKARRGKAEEAAISPVVTCCDQKLPCCDQGLACCDTKS